MLASSWLCSNEDWDDLPVQMVVVSAGMKPRHDLASDTDTAIGERGAGESFLGVSTMMLFYQTHFPCTTAYGSYRLQLTEYTHHWRWHWLEHMPIRLWFGNG